MLAAHSSTNIQNVSDWLAATWWLNGSTMSRRRQDGSWILGTHAVLTSKHNFAAQLTTVDGMVRERRRGKWRGGHWGREEQESADSEELFDSNDLFVPLVDEFQFAWTLHCLRRRLVLGKERMERTPNGSRAAAIAATASAAAAASRRLPRTCRTPVGTSYQELEACCVASRLATIRG